MDDPTSLSGLIADGLTTRQIADRTGRDVRTVRLLLRGYALDNRNDPRHPRFDALLADAEFLRHAHHVRGLTVVELAREVHRHPAVVIASFRAAGIRTRQPYVYPQLQDAAWLQAQFDAGGSMRTIAAQVGCSASAVCAAAIRADVPHRRRPRMVPELPTPSTP